MLRQTTKILGLFLVVGLLYGLFNLGDVWLVARTDEATPETQADAILVLGAAQYDGTPSPVFAARLDHGLTLYNQGLAEVIVVTGGGAPGHGTEATAAFQYLRERGVPEAAILLEVDAATSYESLAASSRFLRADDRHRVILVSDGWHLARSAAIARTVGLDPITSPAANSVYSNTLALKRMVPEAGGLAVGRIIGFRRLDNIVQ